ncbi:unnamed protein product [Prorocentrum cordatum]|uniref:Uncharacterized protein n=1 Tax=Prorocentrum cordatum TaxID=2364126 RepID=A0ABN9WJ31_9DINO|nr:unnamed protein product [Polarella glacialis]
MALSACVVFAVSLAEVIWCLCRVFQHGAISTSRTWQPSGMLAVAVLGACALVADRAGAARRCGKQRRAEEAALLLKGAQVGAAAAWFAIAASLPGVRWEPAATGALALPFAAVLLGAAAQQLHVLGGGTSVKELLRQPTGGAAADSPPAAWAASRIAAFLARPVPPSLVPLRAGLQSRDSGASEEEDESSGSGSGRCCQRACPSSQGSGSDSESEDDRSRLLGDGEGGVPRPGA